MAKACINTSTTEYKNLYEFLYKSRDFDSKKIHKLNFYIRSWQESKMKAEDIMPSNLELYNFQIKLSEEIDNEKTLKAIPLKGNERMYKHYNILNRNGKLKQVSNNSTTRKWVAELNQSPHFSFRLRNISDGTKRILAFPKSSLNPNLILNEDVSPTINVNSTYTDPEIAADVYDNVNKRDIEFYMGDQALKEQEEKADAVFNRQVYETLDKQRSTEILKKLALNFSKRLGVKVNFISRDQAAGILATQDHTWNNERAFYLNGETYFLENEFTTEDVLHEFAHPIISSIRLGDKPLFDKLYSQLSQTEEGQIAIDKSKALYKDYPVESQQEEAIVMFLEAAANKELESNDAKGLLTKLLYWIKKQFRKLFDSKINISKLNENTSLEELVTMLVNKEFVISEKISEEDIVKYRRSVKELQEGLEGIDDANTQLIVDMLFQMAKKENQNINANDYLKELKALMDDPRSVGGLSSVRSNTSAFQKLEAKLESSQSKSEYEKLTEIVRSMLHMDLLSRNINSHISEIMNDPMSDKNDLKVLYHYNKVIDNFENLVSNIESIFNKLDEDGKKLVPDDHPIREITNNIFGNVRTSKNSINSLRRILSVDFIYDSLEGIREYKKVQYEEKLKKATSQEEKDKITKKYENNKITKESIKSKLTGESSDLNVVSAWFESHNVSPDEIFSTVGKKIKEASVKARGTEVKRQNKFFGKLKKLYKAANLDPKNISEFAKALLHVDTVGYYEYFDEDGNKLDEPLLKEREVYSFLNPHKGYRFAKMQWKDNLEKAKKEASDTGNREDYVRLLGEHAQFEEDYFYRRYKDPVYKAKKEILSTDLGKEAFEEMVKALNKSSEVRQSIATSTGLDTKDLEDDLERSQREYNALFSLTTDVDGNDKNDIERAKAELLNKYRTDNSQYRERKLNTKAFERAYQDKLDFLEAKGILPGTREFEEEILAWETNNTFSKIKASFYSDRKVIIDKLEELNAKEGLDSSAISEKYEEISEMLKPYKKPGGLVEGTIVPRSIQVKVQKLEDDITNLRIQSGKNSSLTEDEMNQLSELNQKTGQLTDEEYEIKKALLKKKKEGSQLTPAESRRKNKLIGELMSMSNKEVTEYYISQFSFYMDNINRDDVDFEIPHIEKSNIESLLKDTPLLNKLFKANDRFEKWFKQNHAEKNGWDSENKEKYIKYVPSTIWTVTKPSNLAYYETTEVFDREGNSRMIMGMPTQKYYFSKVKKQFVTGYDKSTGEINLKDYTDVHGNYLPKSIEDGAKDNRFINEEYKRIDREDPARFELLKHYTDFHLESQSKSKETGVNLDYNFRLGYDLPRMRVSNYEIFSNQTFKENVKGKFKSSRIVRFIDELKAEAWGSAVDDFDRGYDFEIGNTMLPTKMFGINEDTVPVTGLWKLDLDQTSLKITESMMTYGHSTSEHKEYKNIIPELRGVIDTLNEGTGKELDGLRVPGLTTAFSRKDGKINRAMATASVYERQILGKNFANAPLKGVSKFISAAARISGTAYLTDLPSALKNAWSQTYQAILEGVGGEYYGMKDLIAGKKLSYQASKDISLNIYTTDSKPLSIQMIDAFGMIQERFEEKSGQSVARSAKTDLFDSSIRMAPRKFLEQQATLTSFYSLMHAIKVPQTINGETKMIPYHKAFELNEDGVMDLKEGIDQTYNIGGEKFIDTVRKGNTIQNRLEGNYSTMDQPHADRFLLAKWAMMFKKFMVGLLINRVGYKVNSIKDMFSPLAGEAEGRIAQGTENEHMGYYIHSLNSTAKFVRHLVKTGKFYTAFTKAERAGMLKMIADMTIIKMIIGELLIETVLGFDSDDDERFKKMEDRSSYLQLPFITRDTKDEFNPLGFVHNNLIFIMLGVRNELDFFIPLPGYAGADTFTEIVNMNSVGQGPILDRSLGAITLGFDWLTDNEQGQYKRDSKAAYIWRQAGAYKEVNAFLKSYGITGKFVDPTNTVRDREQFLKRDDLDILQSLGIISEKD